MKTYCPTCKCDVKYVQLETGDTCYECGRINESSLIPNFCYTEQREPMKPDDDILVIDKKIHKTCKEDPLYLYYLTKTAPILHEYQTILQKPLHVDFLQNTVQTHDTSKIIDNYCRIAVKLKSISPDILTIIFRLYALL